MIFKLLRDVLLADSGVTNLVPTSRIFSAELPDKTTYPAILLLEVDTTVENDLSGSIGLENSLLQVDCYAKGLTECETVVAAVEAAANVHSITFKSTLITKRYDYERDNQLHRYSMDFSIWHS